MLPSQRVKQILGSETAPFPTDTLPIDHAQLFYALLQVMDEQYKQRYPGNIRLPKLPPKDHIYRIIQQSIMISHSSLLQRAHRIAKASHIYSILADLEQEGKISHFTPEGSKGVWYQDMQNGSFKS